MQKRGKNTKKLAIYPYLKHCGANLVQLFHKTNSSVATYFLILSVYISNKINQATLVATGVLSRFRTGYKINSNSKVDLFLSHSNMDFLEQRGLKGRYVTSPSFLENVEL
ncbi:MAG: hypothetical protein JO131_07725 [Gammaproteobacteria bacterium]|nr:hypothetical protein [Gammaproteobacteria bacterium]